MSDLSCEKEAAITVRIMQIILGAMLLGTMVFLLVVLSIGPLGNPHPLPAPIILTLIAFILVGVGLVARSIFMRLITSKARREIVNGTYRSIGGNLLLYLFPSAETEIPASQVRDAQYLLALYLTRTIASAAMIEGWAFFALIAYLVEGNFLILGLAALLTILLAAHFPTQPRAIRWVKWELETLELHSSKSTV